MNHPCSLCPLSFPSVGKLTLHQLAIHRVYRDYSAMSDTIRNRISQLRVQVTLLLYEYPGTRGDDEILRAYFNVHVLGTHRYVSATKTFQQIPEGELTHKGIVQSVKTESLGRIRRFIQKDDREMYHDHSDPSLIVTPHDCCLPSRQVQLRRDIEQQESRRIWGTDGFRNAIQSDPLPSPQE
jgi:hypothetical protein